MGLNLAAEGYESAPQQFEYDWKTVVLYALGIGAKKSELDYLYEARGPRVYPTFGIVPGYGLMFELLARANVELSHVLHGGQFLRVLGPLPSSGTARTVGSVKAIYDMKRLAQVVLGTRTEVDGKPCVEAEWTMFVRDAGGFGGKAPPRDAVRLPDTEPLWVHEDSVSPEQALLYRLSGDFNPLHADPEIATMVGFPQGPILHGLSTYGFVARAVVLRACEGDGSRLRALNAQFRKPVWPGDVLRTEAYALESGRLGLRVSAVGRDEPVVTNCWAEIEA